MTSRIRLAAMVDGLAVQVALEDADVDADRMLQLCLGYAASALGFARAPPALAPIPARAEGNAERRGRVMP